MKNLSFLCVLYSFVKFNTILTPHLFFQTVELYFILVEDRPFSFLSKRWVGSLPVAPKM